jgi:hypothetical protein
VSSIIHFLTDAAESAGNTGKIIPDSAFGFAGIPTHSSEPAVMLTSFRWDLDDYRFTRSNSHGFQMAKGIRSSKDYVITAHPNAFGKFPWPISAV